MRFGLLSVASRDIAATRRQERATALSAVYFPQVGFLICVPLHADPRAQRIEDAWQLMFTTAEYAYYKDFRMRELDRTVGDIWARICDKEIEIVHALAQRVVGYESILCSVSDVCGRLDALLALAQG